MLVGTIPSHQGCRWSQSALFFLIHGTSARFSWRFCGDFAGFLAMDALLDIAGALSEALDLEISDCFLSMEAIRDSGEFI